MDLQSLRPRMRAFNVSTTLKSSKPCKYGNLFQQNQLISLWIRSRIRVDLEPLIHLTNAMDEGHLSTCSMQAIRQTANGRPGTNTCFGLKIRFSKGSVGSSPSSGTN